MSMTVSVRIGHKSQSKTKCQRHHDTRKSKIPGYVNQSKSISNSTIVEPLAEAELGRICDERRSLRNTQRLKKKDSAISTIGIITFGHKAQEIINTLSPEEQDRLFIETAEAIATEVDSDITGLVVHRDESAIHAHFQMPAYNKQGFPLSKSIKPETAKKLQDIAGSVFNELGITRGKPKAERIRDGDHPSQIYNRSVKQLHEDLPGEIETLQTQALQYYQKAKKNYDYLVKSQALARNASANNEKIQKRIVAYERREKEAIAAAESAEKEIEKKLAILSVIEKNEVLSERISTLEAENRKLKDMVTQKSITKLKLN
jgi:TnpA family transposase